MSAEETVNEFIARVVKMDLDGACELVTADVEYDNVPMGKNLGPDALKGFLGAMAGGSTRCSSWCTGRRPRATW